MAVELAVAAWDADFSEAGGGVRGAAGVVVGGGASRQLVEAVALAFRAWLGEELATEALAAAVGVDVDGVFANALIDVAV